MRRSISCMIVGLATIVTPPTPVAAADQLPASYVGSWCSLADNADEYQRGTCDDAMVLTPQGEVTPDCKMTRIRPVKDRGFMLHYRCKEGRGYYNTRYHLHLVGERLIWYPVEHLDR